MASRAGENPRPYSQRLRRVGAMLDEGGYHAVAIIEADDGLVVRASSPGSRRPEVLEIPERDISLRGSRPGRSDPVPHRLFPGGYETFLTTLGKRLDRSKAAAIAIVEGTDFVTVGGIQPVSAASDGVTYEPLDILLLADDIQLILSDADDSPPPESPVDNVPEEPPPSYEPEYESPRLSRFTSSMDSALRMIAPQQAARARG